ncbi:MAG: MFS transporter [Burkholderiaceae bacterium]
MASPTDTTESGYGWVVVGACFVSLAVIFGVAYAFAALFESFATEFAAQRADVSLVYGLSGLIYFTLGIGGGMLADRFGPRAVCCIGMAFITAGLLATSFARSLGMVYLSYGVGIGIGIALVYTPSIGCVQPWFTRRRGLAAGVASAGIGAGTLLVPLLVTLAVASLQWRDALRVLALAVLLVGVSAASLLRRAPSATAGTLRHVPGVTLRDALRSPGFWWLYLVALSGGPTMFIPFAHVSAAARDIGIPDARAVGLVGMIGIGSLYSGAALGNLPGPVLAGAVFDRAGSYTPVIGGCIALSGVSVWAAWRLIEIRQQGY